MAPAVVTPAPPAHLSAAAKLQWKGLYLKALAQAQVDQPGNERAQRVIALKAANALLSVPAPKTAADIDALEPWQVLLRGTRQEKGEQVKFCVTTDGRKYKFPFEEPAQAAAAAPVDLTGMTKAQIVSHAAEVHGLTLDPAAKKEDLIAAVTAKAAQ
jgi:hypothetical protein